VPGSINIANIGAPLLVEAAFVGGEWVSDAKAKAAVTNPADGTILGHVPILEPGHVELAIRRARDAWPAWRAMRADERAVILHEWDNLIRDNREALAVLMTLEQGKPIAESRSEIDYARSFIGWFAEEAKRQCGDIIPAHLPDSRLYVMREPIGVVAAVTPWNFPSAMVTRKAAAALAAGCPVIVVPSSQTPFSAIALAQLGSQAGIPPGVLSVLTGSSRDNVRVLCDSEDVRALSFTGSTEVGRTLIQAAASTVKKVSLELGGHAPFIVFPDADIAKAVDGCISAKFTTGGQDCLAANRIYIHRDIYDTFSQLFTSATAKLKVGVGSDETTDIGPLVNQSAVDKCDLHVADAVSKGARILHEGGIRQEGTLFYYPTVLGDVNDSMLVCKEETFGPIAPLISYDDEIDIARAANETIYGLAAYIYTSDIARAWDVAEALEYGMVALNTPRMTGAPIPFGGYKQSGLGREGSRLGLDEFTQTKYFCWTRN
jgi:succinate-semialdehyde dehydrogenase